MSDNLYQEGMGADLELDVSHQPSVTTEDGFTIEVDACGGFTLYAPGGQVFGWAQTLDEADTKVERERKERTFTRKEGGSNEVSDLDCSGDHGGHQHCLGRWCR